MLTNWFVRNYLTCLGNYLAQLLKHICNFHSKSFWGIVRHKLSIYYTWRKYFQLCDSWHLHLFLPHIFLQDFCLLIQTNYWNRDLWQRKTFQCSLKNLVLNFYFELVLTLSSECLQCWLLWQKFRWWAVYWTKLWRAHMSTSSLFLCPLKTELRPWENTCWHMSKTHE